MELIWQNDHNLRHMIAQMDGREVDYAAGMVGGDHNASPPEETCQQLQSQ